MFLETTVHGELPTVYFYELSCQILPVIQWLSSSLSWWQALLRFQHSCLFPAMALRPLVPRLGCAPETQNMKACWGTGLPCWFKLFISVDRITQSFCREKHNLNTHTLFHSNCPCRECAVLCTSFLKTKLLGNSGGKKKTGRGVMFWNQFYEKYSFFGYEFNKKLVWASFYCRKRPVQY